MFSEILLLADFDHTLTAKDSTIPQRNLEAIEYFMTNGGAFSVNTGRSVPSASGILIPSIPVNAPMVVYNGSAAYDTQKKEFLHASIIDLDAKQVVEDVQAHFPDLHVEVQGVEAHYIFHKCEGWERFNDYNRIPWQYKPIEEIPGPFIKFAIYGQFHDVTVASMYDCKPEEQARMEEALAYVEETYGHKVDVFRSCNRLYDVHAKGCSKLNGGRQLQKALGKKILVCVGDAENDLAMLEGADYAFCPADGTVADRFENVCPCGEGAVADVIYKKIPEILAKQP